MTKSGFTIEKLVAREIYDSSGVPTVEVDLRTSTAIFRASVANGKSHGKYEALDLHDGGRRARGKGCRKAVRNVNETIAKALLGKDVRNQAEIDRLMFEELDGAHNQWGSTKRFMGANAILAVSIAVCRAGAAANQMTLYEYIAKLAGQPFDAFVLPVPSFTVISGGNLAANRLPWQEFNIIPIGASSFQEAMEMGASVFHHVQAALKSQQGKYGKSAAINVSDVGGLVPPIHQDKEALDIISKAINKAGHNGKVKIGIDACASDLVIEQESRMQDKGPGSPRNHALSRKSMSGKQYDLDRKSDGHHKPKSSASMNLHYSDLVTSGLYPIVYIEDPFEQDDLEAFQSFCSQVGSQVLVAGDQLTASNLKRIETIASCKACNCVVLVPGQIGSVTECVEAAREAQQRGLSVVVSHRIGETEDSFIADLAVGLRAQLFKAGAPCRSERLAKYNQLMRIERELDSLASFVGEKIRDATAPVTEGLVQRKPEDMKKADAKRRQSTTTSGGLGGYSSLGQSLGGSYKSPVQASTNSGRAPSSAVGSPTKGTYMQSSHNTQPQSQYWSPSRR